jgi:uncharacterized protein
LIRALRIVALLAVFGWLLGAARAEVQIPDRPEGRVSDYAGVLSPGARLALDEQLRHYESAPAQPTGENQKGAPQIAVVLLPDLGGEPIEDVAVRFGEKWKIGSKSDDGVLLMVGVAEHKIRIETGYGVEGRLPDVLSARIIREIIGPRLHVGDYAGGLRAGVAAIHQALTGQPVTGVDAYSGTLPQQHPGRGGRVGMSGLGLLLLFLLFVLISRGRGGGGFFAGMMLGSMLGGRRGGGFSDGGGFSGGGGSFGGGGASGDY